MKRDNLKLYFIALVPPEPVYSEVMSFKEEIRDRFNSKAALRSPPHITLHMPFQWKEEKEELLLTSLKNLAKTQAPFEIELRNFGAFVPRVIFVDVPVNENLKLFQAAVQKVAKIEWHIYPLPNSRPFRPHMTIAFRDLKKPQFLEAWDEFERRKYQEKFQALDVCLLKHNGKSWDILHRSALSLKK